MSDLQIITAKPQSEPRPLFGRVLIEVTSEATDEVKVGDKVLYLDTSYRPLHHKPEFGMVVFPPQRMHEWHTTECEVRKGDRVRLHYHAICDFNLYEADDGKRYWLVPYDQLYYIERPDGSVHMLNDYCLVKPILTEGGEEKTAAGLITNLSGERLPVARQGILRHRPTERVGQNHIPSGVMVFFVPDADNPIIVDGEELYIMDYQKDIPVYTIPAM